MAARSPRSMFGKFRRLLPYVWQRRRNVAAILALTVAASLTAALQPWPLKVLVDYALGSTAAPRSLETAMGALGLEPSARGLVAAAALASLGLFVVNTSLASALTWAWAQAGQGMVYRLGADLFSHLQRLSLRFHHASSVGDQLSRISGDTYSIYTLVSELAVSPVQRLLTLATISAVAWQLDPVLTLLSLVVAPVLAASSLYFGPKIKERKRISREAASRVMSFVHQTLTAIPAVQAFGREGENRSRYRQLADEAVARSQKNVGVRSTYALVNGLAATVGTALVIYVGAVRTLEGAMTLGSLLVFLAYLRTMRSSFENLVTTYATLKSAEANVDRILESLDAPVEPRELENAVSLRPDASGRIVLENVTFGYEPDKPVLHGISLEIRPGETVAVVGPTGAGKSTLISLLPRFFDPWEGRVTFDGHDLRDLRLASLRSKISLVLQEPFLLPVTVAENIAYGRPEATRDEIVAAATAAQADHFICRLPEGY
ncbi:MAG TPA: ABC transporter ATP-binding protein, partial [Thermoanaerobaculia bacterium]|nr:ABC transporter ATP-binding protein [Thermoanaerobaculia bacterium]